MREPEQFTLDREDKIRSDLAGKINTLDQKIEQKVSNHLFYWVIPVLISLVAGVFSYVFYQFNKLDDKLAAMNDRLT